MKKLASLVFFSLFLSSISFAQPGANDPTFNPSDVGLGNGDGANNEVSVIVYQPDGKILIGGFFTVYNGVNKNYIARLNNDGSIDNTFNTGNGTDGQITAIAVQPDGKIIIGGLFHSFNGIAKYSIARLNYDGTLDNTFTTSVNSYVRSIVIQSDGKILIGGDFANVNNISRNRIARLNNDGTLDLAFTIGGGANSSVNSISIQPDGKILIGGIFNLFNSQVVNYITRLNTNGTIDTSFNSGSGTNSTVEEISLQMNGKILIAGNFTTYNGTTVNKITRLNADGTIDNTFSSLSGINGYITSLAIQSNGKILIGGNFSVFQNVQVPRLTQLNSNGTIDTTFILSGIDSNGGIVMSMNVQPDGRILVGGNMTTVSGFASKSLVRLNTNGTPDITFNLISGANDEISTMAIQSDGKILIGGYFSWYNGTFKKHIVRLNTDGSVDWTFNTSSSISDVVNSIAIQSDGKILVGGVFAVYNGDSVRRIIRLNPNGTLDNSFNTGTGFNSSVNSIVIQPDNKIILGGSFTVYNGVPVSRIVRLNTDGTIDNTFSCNSINSGVGTITLQPDLKILVGGVFNTYYGSETNRLIRLNVDGSRDLSFNIGNGFDNEVRVVIVQQDGKILVGGAFDIYNGNNTIKKLVRLNSDGTPDLTFNIGTGPNYAINSIVLESNGKVIVSGDFQNFNGNPSNGLIRLNVDGTIDTSFSFGSGFIGANNYHFVNSIILLPNEKKILAAGEFMKYNGVGRNRITRILNCVQTSSIDVVSTCGPYTWIDGITYTQPNNTATFNLLNSTGCDSIVTLNLTILSDSVVDFQTACDSYTWIDGNLYTSSTNTPIFVLQNAAGCDSVVTLNLTILSDSIEDLQIACDSYTWINGVTYFASTNSPTFVLQNAAGCDSIITLDLTIVNSSTATDIQTACGSFTWPINGQTYTTSGQYMDTIPNAAGCDSIITLDLTILNSSTATDLQTACGSFTWPINGQTYTTSGQYVDTIPNAGGCDSMITLDLTIIPDLPLVIENTFSMPSDANNCLGEVAVTVSGNADFELDFDSGSQVITSSGYSLVTNLCPGIHDLHVTDNCGDTLTTQIVIPVDSNYVFNNPFVDSLAIDSLGVTVTNCDIYYAGIDTAYIDSIWAIGNTVNVIWNIIDSNGSNFDTTSYVLNNGNGVYWLQLSVFCPNKSVGEYFSVTEAIYFNNGSVSTAGLTESKQQLFEVYPNPTTNQVRINFSGQDAELTVYDLQGKQVLKDRIQNQETISMESFERGVYLFDFRNSNGQSVQRVVKQ